MATVDGTILGALLLTLLVSAVTLTGIDLGFQNGARGAAITLVLTAACTDHAGGGAGRRSRSRRPSPHADRPHEGRM
jgi:ribose/xylose/arabinose/galactoside ABC-type transport system permease subunit